MNEQVDWLIESAAPNLEQLGLSIDSEQIVNEQISQIHTKKFKLDKSVAEKLQQFRENHKIEVVPQTQIEKANKFDFSEKQTTSAQSRCAKWESEREANKDGLSSTINEFLKEEPKLNNCKEMPEHQWPDPAVFSKQLHPYFREAGLPMCETAPKVASRNEYRNKLNRYGKNDTIDSRKIKKPCAYCCINHRKNPSFWNPHYPSAFKYEVEPDYTAALKAATPVVAPPPLYPVLKVSSRTRSAAAKSDEKIIHVL